MTLLQMAFVNAEDPDRRAYRKVFSCVACRVLWTVEVLTLGRPPQEMELWFMHVGGARASASPRRPESLDGGPRR